LAIKTRFAKNTAIIIVGLLIFDLFFVDKNYVSGKDFNMEVKLKCQESPSDVEILKTPSHYRVFEVSGIYPVQSFLFHKSWVTVP
jgi:hypothetical protein